MKPLRIIILTILTTSLSSCSWISSFYIINDTSDNIIITYKLLPTTNKDYDYAINDTIEFYKLVKNSNGDIDRKETTNSSTKGKYLKTLNDNQQIYTLTLSAKTAITFGHSGLLNFRYENYEKRHKIFENVIEMTIYRIDSKDTITFKKSMLADLSRPFDKSDIALIFD